MHAHTSHTLDEDREVETSCYRAVWFCLDDIMKFLDYSILTMNSAAQRNVI